MDDELILHLIRTGKNDLALNALYRQFPAIRQLVRARGGTTRDAEDVFQEALIILVRKVKTDFQLTAKLSTYVFGICRLLWQEQLRKRRPELSTDTLEAAEDTDLPLWLERESRFRLAEQALQTLKDRCRELLLVFYQRQWSLKEIAVKMGYGSEQSARNQKYKCLEAARTRLQELERQTQTL